MLFLVIGWIVVESENKVLFVGFMSDFYVMISVCEVWKLSIEV